MSLLDYVVETPRRTMVLFFLVDCSGSMRGNKIGTVNSAIEEVVPEIKKISENNADAQIKIAVLSFSTGTKWIVDGQGMPFDAETFKWNYLNADGVTDLGAACLQLNEKMSRSQFMSEVTGSFAPAIFLLSDGAPTDDFNHGLAKLKENNWFKNAIKVAIAIGNDADVDVLGKFTGDPDAVITVHKPSDLAKWIKFVSVTSSQIGSKSASVNSVGAQTTSKQEEIIKEIKDFKEEEEKIIEQHAEGEYLELPGFSDDGFIW